MPDKKLFYRSLFLLLLLNGLIKPLWIFGIDRPLQNISGSIQYGHFFALYNITVILSFLADWGLTGFVNRQYADAPDRWYSESGRILLLKSGLTFLYAMAVFFIAWVSGIKSLRLILLLILIQVFNSFFLFFRSIITARQSFNADAYFSVADKTLMLLICGMQLLLPDITGPLTIERFLWAQVISTGLVTSAALVYLQFTGFSFSFNNRFPVLTLLKELWPYALIVLLMAAHYRLDAFILERWLPDGAHQAGLYAGAYRLLDAGNMVGYLLASFLLPFIAKNRQDMFLMKETILNSRHLLLLFSLFITITVLAFAPWIQQVLYHNQDADAIRVLQYCLPALLGYSLVQIYGTVLTATGHIRLFVLVIAISVSVNLLLNLLLIPHFAALGCCYAALISQGIAGIASMWMVKKKTGIPVAPVSLLKYLLPATVLYCFLYFGETITGNNILLLVLSAIMYLALAWLLKLIRPFMWTGLLNDK